MYLHGEKNGLKKASRTKFAEEIRGSILNKSFMAKEQNKNLRKSDEELDSSYYKVYPYSSFLCLEGRSTSPCNLKTFIVGGN
jgi:hypothetical protein